MNEPVGDADIRVSDMRDEMDFIHEWFCQRKSTALIDANPGGAARYQVDGAKV
jgi:hypothetical protein